MNCGVAGLGWWKLSMQMESGVTINLPAHWWWTPSPINSVGLCVTHPFLLIRAADLQDPRRLPYPKYFLLPAQVLEHSGSSSLKCNTGRGSTFVVQGSSLRARWPSIMTDASPVISFPLINTHRPPHFLTTLFIQDPASGTMGVAVDVSWVPVLGVTRWCRKSGAPPRLLRGFSDALVLEMIVGDSSQSREICNKMQELNVYLNSLPPFRQVSEWESELLAY